MDDSLLDEFYNEHWLEPVYTTYMKKGERQKCTIDFSTLDIVSGKHNNSNRNVKVRCFAKSIKQDRFTLNSNTSFYMFAPIRTFTLMFKNGNVDIRDLIKDKKKLYVEFVVYSIRYYELLYHEILK